MKYRRAAGLAALSAVALLTATVSAKAMMIAPAPIVQRVATADCVVIGTVTSLEAKTVKAPRFANDKDGAEYTIAVIKIEKGYLGAKDLTHIRVGFIPPPPPVNPMNPGTGPVIGPIRRPIPQLNLVKDQQICLFLSRHPQGGDFYVAPAYYDFIDPKNANFAKDKEEIEKAAKLLASAKEGLESKNATERFDTAALLVAKYRTAKMGIGAAKQEPIDAKESKLILEAIANAEWAVQPMVPFALTPQTVFFRLGLTEKDGWKQPMDFKQMPDAAKKWLKDNADTYRIQKFVAEEKK
jgi:hypothetical protein